MCRETSVDHDAPLRRHGLGLTAQRLAGYGDFAALSRTGILRRVPPPGSPSRGADGFDDIPGRTAAGGIGVEIDDAEAIAGDLRGEHVAATAVSEG